jgi:uncharacterized repeat protein (TIGR02543 family)
MKKIVIILSCILLAWNAGLARNVQYTVIFKDSLSVVQESKVDSGGIVRSFVPAYVKNGYILRGWLNENDELYNLDNTITTDSVTLTAKWLKVEEITSAFMSNNNSNNNNNNVIKSTKKQVNILFIAVIALAVLLVGLLLYVFLVLNNKKRFRDSILKELEYCPQDGRMDDYQRSIVNKAIEELKQLLPNTNSSKSGDHETAYAIEDLQRRVATLEDSKRSPSIPEKPVAPVQSQPLTLYADSIFDGKFNRVRETPNDDTIFELNLARASDMRADVVVYREAYRKVIANPAYLEGCEKQILGSNTVTIQRKGIAIKDDSGNWIISKKPEVQIS